jgi:hypothetical protein
MRHMGPTLKYFPFKDEEKVEGANFYNEKDNIALTTMF